MDNIHPEDDRQQGNGFSPLEIENLTNPHPSSSSSTKYRSSTARQQQHYTISHYGNSESFVWRLMQLASMYMEYYPRVTALIAAGFCVLGVFALIGLFDTYPKRHTMQQHFSREVDLQYNFKASQIDHWCLFGDNNCDCPDVTEPLSREERVGWLAAHKSNVDSIDSRTDYDVVFVGAETVEEMNGRWIGKPAPGGESVKEYYDKNFKKEKGGDLEALALGIAGDSCPNVLWRLQHGEMPSTLNAKVYWLMVGANELFRDGCSEEAVVLGILRVAEEIALRDRQAVVVIQGILPQSTRRDGSLEPKPFGHHVFAAPHSAAYKAKEAREHYQYWPSIQSINKELEDFCASHDHMIYFDASSLFLGSVSNAHYQSTSLQIVSELMLDYKRLSVKGHQVLGARIQNELKRIIYGEDESNDIEKKDESQNN